MGQWATLRIPGRITVSETTDVWLDDGDLDDGEIRESLQALADKVRQLGIQEDELEGAQIDIYARNALRFGGLFGGAPTHQSIPISRFLKLFQPRSSNEASNNLQNNANGQVPFGLAPQAPNEPQIPLATIPLGQQEAGVICTMNLISGMIVGNTGTFWIKDSAFHYISQDFWEQRWPDRPYEEGNYLILSGKYYAFGGPSFKCNKEKMQEIADYQASNEKAVPDGVSSSYIKLTKMVRFSHLKDVCKLPPEEFQRYHTEKIPISKEEAEYLQSKYYSVTHNWIWLDDEDDPSITQEILDKVLAQISGGNFYGRSMLCSDYKEKVDGLAVDQEDGSELEPVIQAFLDEIKEDHPE